MVEVVYGVFVWRGDGRYEKNQVIKTYYNEKRAQRHADGLNLDQVVPGVEYVVRRMDWITR